MTPFCLSSVNLIQRGGSGHSVSPVKK